MTSRAVPSLRVDSGGRVAAVASGSYQWFLHRGRAPVAFLSTSLAALGEHESLDVAVTVARGCSATVTSQGPTTLLKTESAVSQRWRLTLEPQAHLTFLPWLTIPLPGCRSSVEVEVELGAGASVVGWETLAMGRIASGERYLFDELRAAWRIDGPDGLVLEDRLAIRGTDRVEAAALLGDRTHLGSLYVAGPGTRSLSADAILAALDGVAPAGASRPEPDLLVARALADAGEQLERAFWPVVELVRAAFGQERLVPADVARRWFEAL